MVVCGMRSDLKRHLLPGVLAVLAGVLLVSFVPGFVSEEPPASLEGNGAEGFSPSSESLTASPQPRDMLFLLLIPLVLAGASYTIMKWVA